MLCVDYGQAQQVLRFVAFASLAVTRVAWVSVDTKADWSRQTGIEMQALVSRLWKLKNQVWLWLLQVQAATQTVFHAQVERMQAAQAHRP